MSSLHFEERSFAPTVFGASPIVLAIVIWISRLIPAWRTTRNDPIHALRSEQVAGAKAKVTGGVDRPTGAETRVVDPLLPLNAAMAR